MDNKEKTRSEKFQGAFPFNFGKFEKMAEMMKNCCPGESGTADCCSMMRKMMEKCGEEKEKKETGESGSTT